MANPAVYADLTLDAALSFIPDGTEGELVSLIRGLGERIAVVRPEQEHFRRWCLRADSLYFAENFTLGGADLWWNDPSATTPGASHVSVNTPSVYVDVPASLQAVSPIENMLATDTTEEARTAAAAFERVYTAWKAADHYDLKFHKACTLKSLYGRTAGKVYWDKDDKKPCVEIVEQPRNLWFGYQNDSYDEPEWAAYVQRMTPNAVAEEFGVDISVRDLKGAVVPFVAPDPQQLFQIRPWLDWGPSKIEVWDYWYRKPVWRNGKFVRMETWNVVFAGNVAVQGPVMYPEYGGSIPYIPLFNTFVPGTPSGRPELMDIEPLIREKYSRITSGAQMIASGTAGDFWQLVGPESSSRLAAGLKPIRNKVIGPGPGNRIETITPFIAQFQLEQYLGRLDREMAIVSGLNDLLLGLAPSQVLSSSKAINALVSNYESRISMRRMLLYVWRRDVWEMVAKIWATKDKTIAALIKKGGGRLDIVDPSLNPRDEMETATKALNLVSGKLWSQRRGMDATGVDDPETEQDMIREERTDATMFPADVEVMAQLMGALQSLGLNTPGNVQGQAQAQLSSGQNDLRKALGSATPQNATSSQLPGDQGMTPPIPGAPPEAGGAQPPFAQGPAAQPGDNAQLQTRITGGKATGRILTQQMLGRR